MITEGRIVNTITAGPLLNLLLAMEGMEVPGDPADVWPVFKKFIAVQSSSELDVASFQVSLEQSYDSVGVRCSWTRQLRDDAGGYGVTDRLIEVVYAFAKPQLGVLEPTELWSDQYTDLTAFFAHVEAQSAFKWLMSSTPDAGSIVVEEIDSSDGEAYEPDSVA